ncbi:putative ABC transporter permease [Eubacterium sp.]
MIFTLNEFVLLFFIYSFLGWCVEVAFVAVTSGRIENRGFLNGPVCPIYGCGMLGVLVALTPVKSNVCLLFLGGMIICSAVELFGGWILDKIFHMRWWDYSKNKFNIGGYICLAFSIMWGIAVVFAVRFVHTPIMAIVKKIPKTAQLIIITVFVVIFIIDMVVTLKNLIGIKKSLGQLDKIAEDLHGLGDQLKDVVGNTAINAAEFAGESRDKIVEVAAEQKDKLVEAATGQKEKIAESTLEQREKLAEVTAVQKERLASQKKELEKRMELYVEKIRRNNKHTLNSLPTLNKSGKSIKILEYIKDLKK